jgi:hypothetical protein
MKFEKPIHRNWLLMEISALLFVVGSLLLYRCAGPEVDLTFAFGVLSLVVATGLFRAARARLLENVEQLWKTRGLSTEHARDRAIEYVDRHLLSEPLPLAPNLKQAVSHQRGAAERRWPSPLLIS